jgi:hypothetical protein
MSNFSFAAKWIDGAIYRDMFQKYTIHRADAKQNTIFYTGILFHSTIINTLFTFKINHFRIGGSAEVAQIH